MQYKYSMVLSHKCTWYTKVPLETLGLITINTIIQQTELKYYSISMIKEIRSIKVNKILLYYKTIYTRYVYVKNINKEIIAQ